MAACCQANTITYLNTLPDFLRAEAFSLFYPYDGHFTPNGHRVMAQALAHFLREQHLLEYGGHTQSAAEPCCGKGTPTGYP
jgi:hypothetical protein